MLLLIGMLGKEDEKKKNQTKSDGRKARHAEAGADLAAEHCSNEPVRKWTRSLSETLNEFPEPH